MTTKRGAETAVLDLEAARAAVDAPQRAQAAADLAALEAAQRERQAALATYARAVRARLEPAVTAWAVWMAAAAPTAGPTLDRRFGFDVVRALDHAKEIGAGVQAVAGQMPAVERVLDELASAALLPPARLDALVSQLDSWAARASGFPGQLAAWTRVRTEAAAILATVRTEAAVLEAWMVAPEKGA